MKKIIIPIIALAILASCTKEENKGQAGTDTPVFIQLSAGQIAAAISPDSKAPIEDSFIPSIAGWEANEGEVNYATVPTWQTSATIPAEADNTPVTLDEPQVYNPDNNIKTYMQAWYPQGTLTNGIVTFAAADGTNDAMITAPIFGSKWDNTGKVLEFNRETTQIKFKVVGNTTLQESTSIQSITLMDVEVPSGFDVTQSAVTYAAKGELNVPGIQNDVVSTTAASIGEPVIVKAIEGNQLGLKIVTSNTEHEVTAVIDNDEDFVPGKAYTITLTFGQEGINLTANVSAWNYSGTGSIEDGVIK